MSLLAYLESHAIPQHQRLSHVPEREQGKVIATAACMAHILDVCMKLHALLN